MIWKSALFGAAMAVLVALPLFAQIPPDSTRTRIAGTVEKLDGNVLTVDHQGDYNLKCLNNSMLMMGGGNTASRKTRQCH